MVLYCSVEYAGSFAWSFDFGVISGVGFRLCADLNG
jgi:hypothetical protein